MSKIANNFVNDFEKKFKWEQKKQVKEIFTYKIDE